MRWTIAILILATLPACTKQHGQTGGTVQDSTYFGRLSFVVQDNYTFGDYEAALVQTGYSDTLAQPGPFTILVPNNDAMTAAHFIGQSNGVDYFLQVTDPTLSQYVRYYILPGRHPFAGLPLGSNQMIRSLLGTPVYVTKYLSGGDTVVTVNGSLVIAQDLPATNGLIEVLVGVPEPQVSASLWVQIQQQATLTDFATAIQRAGLTSLFSRQDTPLTVLAPSNYAFTQLYTAINQTESLATPDSILAADPSFLRDVVLNHVLRGTYFVNDFTRADTTRDSVHLSMYGGGTVLYKGSGPTISQPFFFSGTLTQQYGQYYDPTLGAYVYGYYGPVYTAGATYYGTAFFDQVPANYQDLPTGSGILQELDTVLLPD